MSLLQEFSNLHSISLELLEKEGVTCEEKTFHEFDENKNIKYQLNFPIRNNKKELCNNIIVPLGKDLEIIDPIYQGKKPIQPNLYQLEDNAYALGMNEAKDRGKVYLTFSPLDRLLLLQLGYKNVVMAPINIFNRNDSNQFFGDFAKKFQEIQAIYLCLPELSEKSEYEEEFSRRLDQSICKLIKNNELGINSLFEMSKKINWNKEDNPELFTIEQIARRIDDAFKPFKVQGVCEFNDVSLKVKEILSKGLDCGVSTGWDNLDYYFTVKKKSITLVHGLSSNGTSTFLKNIALNLARIHKWNILYYSPDDKTLEDFYISLLEKALNYKHKTKNTNSTREIQPETVQKTFNFLDQRIKSLSSDMGSDFEEFINSIKTCVKQYGIDALIIDPWTRLNLSGEGSEMDKLTNALRRIQTLAENLDIHIFIAGRHNSSVREKDKNGDYAIPTVMQVQGGAIWNSFIDSAICVYRKRLMSNDDSKFITHLYVQKVKDRTIGRMGATFLATNKESETLLNSINYEALNKAYKEGTDIVLEQVSKIEKRTRTTNTKLDKEVFLTENSDPFKEEKDKDVPF